MSPLEMIGIGVFARPLLLDAARVKENCFSLSFIAVPSCQSWWRAPAERMKDEGLWGRTQFSYKGTTGQREGVFAPAWPG
jgi:hypothetical protein